MYINSVTAINFKNLKEVQQEFSQGLNCLVGGNGAGKTSLLDALYYLSFCKSFLNTNDQEIIRHDENYFMIHGKYSRSESEENISCAYQKSQKKQFKRNDKIYNRLADHIGLLPLVIISPSDTDLIAGGSDDRRKFMDSVISQYDPSYLEYLIRYNRALLQRNQLLKQFAAEKRFDSELIEIWESRMEEYAKKIHPERETFIRRLVPLFQHFYSSISLGKEIVGLEHQSDLYRYDFRVLLKESLSRDMQFQFTTVGIHKDDLILSLSGFPIKKLGSQGQKKTYLIALKLAQYEFIKEVSGLKPILLLDDIFDKLDRSRVEQIIKLVSGDGFGQIFITDTNREHLHGIIKTMNADYKLFNVISGNLFPEK